MINYACNISKSGLSIYDNIDANDPNLFIPINDLESILANHMVGLSLEGYPLRTRSKIVKQKICSALGYPIPKSFSKTKPRFPGQNFDVYTQKSLNVQIWNEEVDGNRRYVFFKVDDNDRITAVKVITGNTLALYDKTGTLTRKYQATMKSYGKNICSSNDSNRVANWIIDGNGDLSGINPNNYPLSNQLLKITEIYHRLLPMVGKSIHYLDAIQERNRGAELHSMICEHLGYSIYDDDGTYPDIANQLLEVKLQTSPTIDLGLHSPEDRECIASIGRTHFYSEDVRYAIFDGEVNESNIILKNLYLVTGEDFTNNFTLFNEGGTNSKIQLPLPNDFFD